MVQTYSTLEDVQKVYDWFEQMRTTQSVWLDESSGCWHVFRSDDVLHVISDATLFSSERRRPRFQARAAANAGDVQPRGGRSMIAMDPPQHRHYRNLVSYAFTPCASDRPLFKRWADGLLRRQLSDAEFFRPEQEQRKDPEFQRLMQTFEDMSDYFRQMLEERKRVPRQDMMSDLLDAEGD